MSKSVAHKHYLRAISRWPADVLRPESQFQDAIRKRVDRKLLDAGAIPLSAGASSTQGVAVNEKKELEQVNALYSLLENRYERRYPLSGSLLRPTSNPTHYTDLIEELEKAPTRSWWEATLNKWRGFIRLQ